MIVSSRLPYIRPRASLGPFFKADKVHPKRDSPRAAVRGAEKDVEWNFLEGRRSNHAPRYGPRLHIGIDHATLEDQRAVVDRE